LFSVWENYPAYPLGVTIARKGCFLEEQPAYRIGSPFAGSDDAARATAAFSGGDDERATAQLREAASASYQAATAGTTEELGHGVWGQTAASAVLASGLLTLFAVLCWQYFPGGGLAVTGLGFAVSVLGLSSNRRRLATALLATHTGLFVACYLRVIQ